MSGLWTPSGDFEPQPGPTDGGEVPGPAPGPSSADEELMREEVARFQAQLAATPAIEVIANHAVGLFELARLHLALAAEGPEEPEERLRRIGEARLCCDAFAGIVEGLTDQLGDASAPLTEGLAQQRIAIVEVERVVSGSAETS